VEWPLKFPDIFQRLTTKPPKGILLFGPPGTGKTLLAKAVANESECNFISIKGPELLSKWVGESEKGVREIFRKARQASPSIIFFDEVDALVPRRGSYTGSSHVTESVVSQILTELDGLEELKDVVVIGATNRPDMMDTALMRPGRLERHIYVPPPDDEGRRQIFKVYLKDEEGVLAKDIDLDTLVAETKGFVGADIEALVREAKLYAIRDFISKMGGRSEIEMKDAMENIRVTKEHIRRAQERVKPSLDSDAIESAERQSWEFLYNEEQRQVLEKALNVAKRALLLEKGEEVAAAAEKIRNLVTSGKKQFDVIREQTTELEKQMVEEK
jgi:transitional endoplasmic reticulum ATPase